MDPITENDHGFFDPIKVRLNAVNRRLTGGSFLKNLTPSRLPSQAASSETSLSPVDAPLVKEGARAPSHHRHSHLNLVALSLDDFEPDEVDLTQPLILDPSAEHHVFAVDPRISHHLASHFVKARDAYATMAADRGFTPFAHGHQDLVLAVDFNYFGTRMATASSDHRLKVWDKKDEQWAMVESWKAHDAEIVDVKWNGPFMGEVVGSIGEDGRCKLWQEDVTEVPMSGTRFKLITNIGSMTNAPFMSLDFKNIMQETWLALITRDGHLSVHEPSDPSNLNEWTTIAEHWVCENTPPQRQEEVGFKVVFHKEKLPCYTAIMAGLDRKSLGLAVAAMNDVFVFRTDKAKRFWPVVTLTGARQIIRDLAWANGSMRGHDIIATASKDGVIRIYELSTPRSEKTPSSGGASSTATATDSISSPQSRARKNAPSGIGAGLAGASKAPAASHDHEQYPGRIRQVAKLTDELTNHHGAVWRVAFSQMGDLLVSTGDDAAIRTWKKAVNGHWAEYAEIETARDN